ncbi:hypothetical protein ACFYTU_25895, partial [Nonomuraea angiospora]|uniref:hypothetical protein n=1 Tax=Nonomuraea angiospora TaxID=46172 RepID=UPI0036AC2487
MDVVALGARSGRGRGGALGVMDAAALGACGRSWTWSPSAAVDAVPLGARSGRGRGGALGVMDAAALGACGRSWTWSP